MRENALRPFALSQRNYEDGKVLGHIDFLENRKICMMLLLDDEGSELELQPFDERFGEARQMKLPGNRLVLFRQDVYSFSYQACGSGSSLQCHLVCKSAVPSRDAHSVAVPSQLMNDNQVMVRSIGCHYPGCAGNVHDYWAVTAGCNDGLVRVPPSRWDVTEYYSPEDKEGFTYATHGGFCHDDDVIMFDNTFFEISDAEAGNMAPSQRLVLQTGYEALRNAGINKAKCQGLACGVYLGDSGCDWPQLFAHNSGPQRCLGSMQSIGGASVRTEDLATARCLPSLV
ncbi:unnamed protein product [Effrenium voratum]|nr:unnamed protein product [Effrenium voratum]